MSSRWSAPRSRLRLLEERQPRSGARCHARLGDLLSVWQRSPLPHVRVPGLFWYFVVPTDQAFVASVALRAGV